MGPQASRHTLPLQLTGPAGVNREPYIRRSVIMEPTIALVAFASFAVLTGLWRLSRYYGSLLALRTERRKG